MNDLLFGVERYLLWNLHPLVVDDDLHRTAGKADESISSIRIVFQFGSQIFTAIIIDNGQECLLAFYGSIRNNPLAGITYCSEVARYLTEYLLSRHSNVVVIEVDVHPYLILVVDEMRFEDRILVL